MSSLHRLLAIVFRFVFHQSVRPKFRTGTCKPPCGFAITSTSALLPRISLLRDGRWSSPTPSVLFGMGSILVNDIPLWNVSVLRILYLFLHRCNRDFRCAWMEAKGTYFVVLSFLQASDFRFVLLFSGCRVPLWNGCMMLAVFWWCKA